jgi:hypothetical protein
MAVLNIAASRNKPPGESRDGLAGKALLEHSILVDGVKPTDYLRCAVGRRIFDSTLVSSRRFTA